MLPGVQIGRAVEIGVLYEVHGEAVLYDEVTGPRVRVLGLIAVEATIVRLRLDRREVEKRRKVKGVVVVFLMGAKVVVLAFLKTFGEVERIVVVVLGISTKAGVVVVEVTGTELVTVSTMMGNLLKTVVWWTDSEVEMLNGVGVVVEEF